MLAAPASWHGQIGRQRQGRVAVATDSAGLRHRPHGMTAAAGALARLAACPSQGRCYWRRPILGLWLACGFVGTHGLTGRAGRAGVVGSAVWLCIVSAVESVNGPLPRTPESSGTPVLGSWSAKTAQPPPRLLA